MTRPRIDMVKRITPVRTHDGRVIARFSDRATARRMATAWGGCILGSTYPDPGCLTSDRATFVGYGTPAPIPARYVHPDPARAVETARFVLSLPGWSIVRAAAWEWFVGVTESAEHDGGTMWPAVDGTRWFAMDGLARPRIGTEYPTAFAAMAALYRR